MSATLVDADTVNLQELLGNGRRYRVPAYQRDYSWDEEQWEDLWEDILALRDSEGARHYLGSVVFQKVSDREFLIMDGQQRLATLSIFALAIIRTLHTLADQGVDAEDNRRRAEFLRARFIGESNPVSLLEQSKLELNETNRSIYEDYLVQGKTPPGLQRLDGSNKRLVSALEFFEKAIGSTESIRNKGKQLAGLLSDFAALGLLFIRITVTSDLSAFTVFETLNARGLELSTTDLLKNYLFSKMAPGDLVHLQRRWKQLISLTTQERFPEFLRYHLLCSHRKIRKEQLYKMVRDEVKTGNDVLMLMDQLEPRAEVYSAFRDPNSPFWSDRRSVVEPLRELRLFRVTQIIPVVIAAYEKLDSDGFTRVLEMLVVLSFRYSVIGRQNTRSLEPAYSEAAIDILNGSAKTPRQIFDHLKVVYREDDSFMSDFREIEIEPSGVRKNLAKYILLRLEQDASGRPNDFETDPATIEHILPENPGTEWKQHIDQSRWDDLALRLGNLIPLESSRNRQVANADYGLKRVQYEGSSYNLAKDIADEAPETWSDSHIVERQKKLAKRAAHVWRCDF
jgi:hypothetical protein